MKIGIMQPYFLPYIGYFQLMNCVDKFVVYDNIQFTKKGWINRNRMLVNGSDTYFSIPLKKDSDFLDVRERFLSDIWKEESLKLLNRVKENYRKAPHFQEAYPVIEKCFLYENSNLFDFVFNSLKTINYYLGIQTELIISSQLKIDHSLRSEEKVIAICKELDADLYINPIGGTALYDKNKFADSGVLLKFHKVTNIEYPQFSHAFVPFLSILDVIMFNSKEKVKDFIDNNYVLIEGNNEL